MPRPRKPRCIRARLRVKYFKPQGVPLRRLEEIVLSKDEVEALRLKNLKQLDQATAAKQMKISASTFQRILAAANNKVAEALLGGKAIRFEE